MESFDIAVVGGGIIGLAVAWRCTQRGLTVAIADPDPRHGAWHTAAGMLAPTTELHYTETSLLQLNLASLARYPDFVAELEAMTGETVGYERCGAIAVAWDGADLTELHELQQFAVGLDIDAQLLTGREVRQLEPAVAAGVPGGLYAPGDHQVDPRRLHHALTSAADAAGVRVFTGRAELSIADDTVCGIVVDDAEITAGTVVLAAGSWSGQVAGLPDAIRPPVRPVKGQTLRLRPSQSLALGRILRASVRGSAMYVVPHADGGIVVGASVEETGFDLVPRAGAVYEVLRDAQSVLPELSEAAFVDVSVGLRPGTPDNVPVIGPSGIDGLVYATGHYRNGILLAPLTADGIADLIVDGKLPDPLTGTAIDRFDVVTP